MTDKESPLADIYTLLGVSQMSPMEGVRTRYYKLTRAIHRELMMTPDIDRRNQLLYDLKFICIAYDILSDPVTRTDYDLRTMGLRGVSMVQTPEEKKPGELGQRLHLKIGELLNVAGLLEGSELEIACDMHKAMPEMQFGSFLVKQGFIEEYQLEAVLFAQKLLRKGLITVVQYQAAMEELESSGVSIAETVVERGYVTQSDLDHLEEVEAEAEAELNRPVTTPVYTQPPLQPKADEQVASHSNLLAQMLPPGSPDVVSARASGNGEKAAGILGKLLSGKQDGDITAPPSTMGNLLKASASASGMNPVAEAPAAPPAPPPTPPAPPAPSSAPPSPPEEKAHKEPKKKRNIELHEVAQAFDPNLNRSANQDVASDTYEGAAYKDDLLKTENQRDTGELSGKIQPSSGLPDRGYDTGPELLTADDVENSYKDIMSPGDPDSASSDQLGQVDAESSGVEFQGFVDTDEEADDEDEDEDEEEEDEGNITLIDSEGAALVEASLPPADAEQELQFGAGRDKTTDSTHERIPAYAFSDRALHDLDSVSTEQQPSLDAGRESGDDLEATKKAQSTTRDRIPAFRPPLHNTFQLDETEQSSEGKQEEGEAGDRQLVISNAVPSWKDNLEWNAPDSENQEQQKPMTASQESEVVDISKHLDLEAIEPQNKPDDELKSFLGEEYREDLNELGESGRPLWDVEDDEFIVPSAQKRSGQGQSQDQGDEEERLAKEKRVSGGWQRLKNPFELQLDAQGSGRSTQTTGEEAVVEVPPQESLDRSRSETSEFARPSIPGITKGAEPADHATASTDSADSFVEASDSLETPEEEDGEPFITQLKGSANPSIVIGLDDAEEAESSKAADSFMALPNMDTQVPTVEPPIVDDATIQEAEADLLDAEAEDVAEALEVKEVAESEEGAESLEGIPEAVIPVFEAADVSIESDQETVEGEEKEGEARPVSITSMETQAYEELADEVREPELPDQENLEDAEEVPAEDTDSDEIAIADASEVEVSDKEIVDEEIVEEEIVDEETTSDETAGEDTSSDDTASASPDATSTSDAEVVPPAPAGDTEETAAAASTSDNGTPDKEEDDTASDDKASATDAESALSKRRRMLGRRHHRGKP